MAAAAPSAQELREELVKMSQQTPFWKTYDLMLNTLPALRPPHANNPNAAWPGYIASLDDTELAKARSDMRTWLMDALDHEQKEMANHGLTHNSANLALMRRALTWATLAPKAPPGFHKSEISFNTEGGAPTNMYLALAYHHEGAMVGLLTLHHEETRATGWSLQSFTEDDEVLLKFLQEAVKAGVRGKDHTDLQSPVAQLFIRNNMKCAPGSIVMHDP